jgi:hypothetical protein
MLARERRMNSRAGFAAGILAAIAVGVGLFASVAVGSGAGTAELGDNELLAEVLAGDRAMVAVFQAAMTVGALALVVFAAAIRRHLAGQQPAGSLAPTIAGGGLVLTAALCLVGAGIGTELFWGLGDLDAADPDSLAAMYHLLATMSWVWAGAGLTAGALAYAGLKHAAVARWIGCVSAVAAVAIVGVSLVPLQYLSAFAGALWLLTVSIGLSARTTS